MPFWRRSRPEDEAPAEAVATDGTAAPAEEEPDDDLAISDEELEAEALAAAESASLDMGFAPPPWGGVPQAPASWMRREPVTEAASSGPVAEPPLDVAEPPPTPDVPDGAPDQEWGVEAGGIDAGVRRSRIGFMGRLRSILGVVDESGPSWEDVEETLIAGDVGGVLSMEIVERARSRRAPGGPEAAVRSELAAILAPGDRDWMPAPVAPGAPAVVLVIGVNGTGKTTTIGKLAARYRAQGLRVVLAAGDTFRAAAIDQLRIWADRSGAEMVAHAPGADPGAVVYDALDAAAARHADIVIVDTAGRLHTKSNLMDELAKIRRIVDKRFPGAQPEALFVLDATTGQNGLAQARSFHETVGLTGLVLTKLDSTSKGGIVFAIEDTLAVPVRFVGVGERVDDLIPFDPDAFVAALFD